MSKRCSKYKRMKGDWYITPESAVLPFLDHIGFNATYFEPCAGDGSLIKHLAKFGHPCVGAMDIEPKADMIPQGDALLLCDDDFDPHVPTEYIITNPPWTRALLHPMIDRFSGMAPTWLIFEADWMHTKQSVPFMRHCHKIVSVGRVSWMGNGVSGKDNAAWYLFDQRRPRPTEAPLFYGRAA